MHPNERERLQASLFKQTSAFDQPAFDVEVPELKQKLGPSPSERIAKIASLIEDAIDASTDTELLPLLEEALELARQHA